MTHETSKAVMRRLSDSRFITRYFVGNGIDIGAGEDGLSHYTTFFPKMANVRIWDWGDGDAQYMQNVPNDSYDFIISSHCLEHIVDPYIAMQNWIRILKPQGYMIITVPDEDIYEQKNWPSRYNGDHKTSWTIQKTHSWSPVSINCTDFFRKFPELSILKLELLDANFDYSKMDIDQTLNPISESAIEIVLQKKD
jgi:SAM-dependent methyltransferase